MLSLVTAVPGSGKTLKVVEMIFDYLNKGYAVFTNIVGLKVAGVYRIESDEDWRDLDNFKRLNPEMSNIPICVIYDEAHEHPAFSAKDLLLQFPRTDQGKRAKQDILDVGDSLTLHRHFGMDIVLITQNPKLLRGEVLAVVGRHLHLRRIFGMYSAWIYEFAEAQTNPNMRSVRDDALIRSRWKFPKHLFGCYVSAETHTHKRNFPVKYIAIGLAVTLIPTLGILFLWNKTIFSGKPLDELSGVEVSQAEQTKNYNSNPAFNNQANQANQAPIVQPSSDSYRGFQQPNSNPVNYDINAVQPVLSYSGCISTSSTCSCYTTNFQKVELPIRECKKSSSI